MSGSDDWNLNTGDTNNKNVLLVSYVFPPYYGVGGRRWAKHAFELTRLGYTVHVICAENPFGNKSLWYDLVEDNSDIILHKLPGVFPKVLLKYEHNFLDKLFYKFWLMILPIFTKGAYLDRTIFWKYVMLAKARKLISQYQIKNVICSGAPFGAMYYTTLLRKWFKDIFIINDLRDPWTWSPNWGFPGLNPERMKYESLREQKTVENSDLITVPTLEMKVYLDKKYPLYKDKIKTLFHFFDKSEIAIEEKTRSKKVRLIFYGSIYHHIPELVDELAQVIANFKEDVLLDVYTDKIQYKDTFDKFNASNVTFYKQLPPKDLFKKFKNYDYVLMMIPSVGVDHISTKFYEIIYSRTPILIFSNNGLAPKFVVDNNLGIHVLPGDLDNAFEKLTKNKEYKHYNTNFDLTEYSIEKNGRQLVAMFSGAN